MKTTIITLIGLFFIATIFSSCGGEKFVNARDVTIWNSDTIPLEIYVNGDKAIAFDEFYGDVYLMSGDYEIVAKSGGKEVGKVNISLSKETEENEYYRFVFIVGDKKSYALMDMSDLYDKGNELEVEDKFFNTNYLEIETNTFRRYWQWNTLPNTVYQSGGGTPEIFQLFEIPNEYEAKSDDDIVAYCSPLVK